MFQTRETHGFSLLEALISFSLVSFSIAVIYHASTGGLSNAAKQRDLYVMAELARSLLDEATVLKPRSSQNGTFGKKWYWRLSVAKLEDPHESYLDESHELVRLSVEVVSIADRSMKVTLNLDEYWGNLLNER